MGLYDIGRGSRDEQRSRPAPKVVRPRSREQEGLAWNRKQERLERKRRRSALVDPFKEVDAEVEYVPPVPRQTLPDAWAKAVEQAVQVVEIADIGLDYLEAVLLDRVIDLWDAVYIVSGNRYPAGARLGEGTMRRLAKRVFFCSECKHWRAWSKAGMTVSSLYPSVRCLDCRRVVGAHSRGGYFRDAGNRRKWNKAYRPERNSLGQTVDDVMSELVDDDQWGYDEGLEAELRAVRQLAREEGLIVKIGPELTPAMRGRRKEVSEANRSDRKAERVSKKEVKKQARIEYGHDHGRACWCSKCVANRS